VREGVRDPRTGCEDSVSEVASEGSFEIKDEEGRGKEGMEDKNATTGVTNN